ncbi:MAG: hypothetical protein IKJ01_00580 [Lachnospiraceae bacterium]|nr:hypothetical protein [Lachnospiraceae bacterium]
MFGSRKRKSSLEQSKQIFLQIAEKKEGFEANYAQITEESKRMQMDVSQIYENTHNLVERATINVETEATILQIVNKMAVDITAIQKEYRELCILLEKQLEAEVSLVEEQKHYTTPAKYLTEVPSMFRGYNQLYMKLLEEMEEHEKQIGVLALNAAIEAGRLGEDAKQFIDVAEEIRQNVIKYEEKINIMQEELEASNRQIEILENTIQSFIALLRNNNKSTTRLLKWAQEIVKKAKNSVIDKFTDNTLSLRDKVVGLRNMDEEIVKSGERNKIQLGDIKEELQAQKKELTEVAEKFFDIFQLIEKQK